MQERKRVKQDQVTNPPFDCKWIIELSRPLQLKGGRSFQNTYEADVDLLESTFRALHIVWHPVWPEFVTAASTHTDVMQIQWGECESGDNTQTADVDYLQQEVQIINI